MSALVLQDAAAAEEDRLASERQLLYEAAENYHTARDRAQDPKAGRTVGLTLAKTYEVYTRQLDRVREAEDRLRRAREERANHPRWEQRRQELAAALRDHYGDYGPHYDVLIRRLVTAELLAEQMEASGRTIGIAEMRSATRETLEAVAALQRYTEAQKTEMIRSEVNTAIRSALQVLEEVIAPVQPTLWNKALDTFRQRLAESA